MMSIKAFTRYASYTVRTHFLTGSDFAEDSFPMLSFFVKRQTIDDWQILSKPIHNLYALAGFWRITQYKEANFGQHVSNTMYYYILLPAFSQNHKPNNPKWYNTQVYEGGVSTYKMDICLPIHH